MATWLACDKMHSEAAVSACVDPHVGTCAKREAESQTRALLHRRFVLSARTRLVGWHHDHGYFAAAHAIVDRWGWAAAAPCGPSCGLHSALPLVHSLPATTYWLLVPW